MSVSVLTVYSTPIFFTQAYAIFFESLLHASCSTPPKGRLGQSYFVPSRMSLPPVMALPSNCAMKGWGAVVSHSSQCLYIRSSTTNPLARGRSGYFSAVLSFMGIWCMRMTLFSSGEKRNPSTGFSQLLSCLRPLPSGFISHTWLVPLALDRKAILVPPFIHAALLSLSAVVVSSAWLLPSAFIICSVWWLLS